LDELKSSLREKLVDSVLLGPDTDSRDQRSVLHLCKIYGASAHLVQLPDVLLQKSSVEFVGNYAITQIEFVGMTVWGRIVKRAFDFVASTAAIVLLLPVWIALAALIKWEDPDGPIIFKNQRVGKDGKPFTLYKFRYMYWKYCVKDAYGVKPQDDDALKFEQDLMKSDKNTRTGPIYKITKDDPRKMKIGAVIERFSLDELPQLFNVFLGNMSIVGPRPHQPREVDKYDEWHRQVLTIKPGITGMGQVYARETSEFDREVELDTYYIENWNIVLDFQLILGTLRVLFLRNR
jgi:lipopolysaccharide/colanic/teichoic acid biosynthesis glycosyltransferase